MYRVLPNPPLSSISTIYLVFMVRAVFDLRLNIKVEPTEDGGNKLKQGGYRLLREYDNFITSLAHFVNYGFSLPTLQLKWRQCQDAEGSDEPFPQLDIKTHCTIVSLAWHTHTLSGFRNLYVFGQYRPRSLRWRNSVSSTLCQYTENYNYVWFVVLFFG